MTLTGFATNEAGAPVVTFDGVPATITCDTPAGTPGAVDVTIANNNGAATLVAGYSYF